MSLTSVSGFIALLDEDLELQQYALEKLNVLADEFWAEASYALDKIEALAASPQLRELASLVSAKIYYHLGKYDLAMKHALGAGALFDVFGRKTEFIETLVAKFVDEYIKLRIQQVEEKEGVANKVTIDERLEKIVTNMFDRCFKEGDFKSAFGIALESRRIDKAEHSIIDSNDVPGMLAYAYKAANDLVVQRDFRQQVLRLLVKIHEKQLHPNFSAIVQCLVFLDDSARVGQILLTLAKGTEDQELLAYQIAFDLCENATQQFRNNVRDRLPTGTATAPALQRQESAMDVDNADMENARITKLRQILSAELSIGLFLEFLCRNNHSDLTILKNVKNAIEVRNSVCHSGTIFANALMHAGTTKDTFLRDNLEWLSRATNWSKFSATAGLGVIHKGHLKEGKALLAPYLPQQNAASSPYSEGGALYGLGIIHANHGSDEIINYLVTALQNAQTSNKEVLQHGACLGLGVAAMATGNEQIYDMLKDIVKIDAAVPGEAAGLGLGLIMLGNPSEKAVDEMLADAHETQHEKIIRGLAIGLSLLMYGREEQADTLIEQLTLDKDPILRYGGMYTIAMAYCGTANDSAIKRLLHVAVSDVSDDVRRAAVTAIGFLLFKQPRETPRLVSLLAASYNPHVRYGAALAVGISCAGTGLKEAIDLLEPLAHDSVDFVRQGAVIALAMVYIQTTKAQDPRVETIRKLFEEKITDKHEELIAKFGAILATGIIDAGGRNVTISLRSRSGHNNMLAIVGLALFTQFWYWYPLIHFISLAFTPTTIVGLNKDLKMPKWSFKSNAKPVFFAYPADVKPPTQAAPTKVAAAVLSTAHKAKKKSAKDEPTPMETAEEDKAKAEKEAKEKEEKEKEDKAKAEKEEKEEATFEIIQNPARVTPAQARFISLDVDQRYVPIKATESFGVVMLKDLKPGEAEEFVPTGKETATPAPAATAAPKQQATQSATQQTTTNTTTPGGGSTTSDGEPKPPESFDFE